jgi:hypothetical protein
VLLAGGFCPEGVDLVLTLAGEINPLLTSDEQCGFVLFRFDEAISNTTRILRLEIVKK